MRKAPRILLVMDSSSTAQSIMEKLLEGGFDPKSRQVRTKNEFSKELKQKNLDIIIADYDLDHFNGYQVLEFIKHHNIDLPLIFIGNSIENKMLVQIIENGASDFISTNNLSRLIPAVHRELNNIRLIKQQLLSYKDLQNSNNFLLNVFDAVQEGISVLDNNLTIIRTNSWIKKQFKNILPVIGKKCYEVYQNRTSICPSCPCDKTLKDGFSYQESISIQLADSQTKWFELTAYPFKNSNGDVVGIIQSVKDITKRKKAEDKLLKLNKELEHRVKMRTAQLETTNKELESFSYSVSHDLRSPLARIEGYSELLLSSYYELFDDEGKHYLDRIICSVNEMSDLIEDLLKLSRVTRSEMEFSQVNLSNIAKSIVNTLFESEPKRKAEFLIHDDLEINGDGHLLRSALENLLNNAWKFTRNNPIAKIEFGAKNDQKTPIFYVKDNGAGFNMSHAEQLFIPFKRLHSDKEFPGTGVGLATVQRIVSRHGGKIWAEGKENAGAVFYFTLSSNGKL